MNSLFLTHANAFCGGVFRTMNLAMENGVITAMGADLKNTTGLPVYDAAGRLVLPGFIDVHTHGGAGVDVNAADRAGLCKISSFFAAQGTTRWLASVLTDTKEQTLRCMGHLRAAIEQGLPGAQLLGIHLEGPFLASAYKGAMPEALLRPADFDLLRAYIAASGNHVRYLTVAPEVAGVPALVQAVDKTRTAIAIGHSGASYEQCMQCIENGAISTTHTFNGMQLFHQHAPSVMGAVLASDVYCEAICDGRHLHPGSVCMLLNCKGADRVIAVTDSIMAAGLPDGRYKLGVNDVIVENGDARLAEGNSRAGSTLTMLQAFRNLLRFTGAPMERIVPLLTENPARMLGEQAHYGALAVGMAADAIVLDDALTICSTIVGGRMIYENKENP